MSAAATPLVGQDAAATLSLRGAAVLFLSFAFAYFFSALVRGVTATLAPAFRAVLGLHAGHLGLLAGSFFFGFAAMQLPLGGALDRYGPRRVLLGFIGIAVVGCAAFAMARSFAGLTMARGLIGMGVSACLMAPMTAFRQDARQAALGSPLRMTTVAASRQELAAKGLAGFAPPPVVGRERSRRMDRTEAGREG